jgi:hypothetical protein
VNVPQEITCSAGAAVILYVLSRAKFLTEFDSGYRQSADRF